MSADVPLLRRARLGDVDLAYRLGGDGPPVLLIHGSWDDHRSWDEVAARLRPSCTVVAYDRRGHSASTAPPGQGRIGEDVADAAALLDHLDLLPAGVVGHSYGSSVALLLAIRHPELVSRVIVHEPPLYALLAGDPNWERVRQEAATTMVEVAAGLEAGDTEAAARRFIDDVAFGPGAWDTLFCDRGRATVLTNADTWLDQSKDPERLAVDITPLTRMSIPLTVTTGTASLPAFPEITRRVVELLPAAELVTINGAAHGAHLSHAGPLADIILPRVLSERIAVP